ncbi:MAG TPA: zinc-binding alcohol dehydrogenase family protein [Croceicoccus sp.]|nr:zinc-binding alcohol dehydrogenase family protein [Croceicoccus sp.]
MRAAIIGELGGDPAIGDIPVPPAAPGTSAVRVLAAGLKPTDIMISKGVYNPPVTPYVIGGEGVGLLAYGQRVYFGHSIPGYGSACEITAVPQEEIWPLPDDVAAEQAIALAISGTGALIPLQEANIKAGENVLILGATGPLGQIALQVARLLGAARVVGAGRSAEALAEILARGIADAVVPVGGDVDDGALRAAGPFDVVLDCVFGAPAQAALRATAPGGRMMSIGVGAGMHLTVSLGELVNKSVHGVGTGQRPAAERRAAFDRLIAWHREGNLSVSIRSFALDEVAEAWALVKASPHGKVVLRVGAADKTDWPR